MFSRGWTSELGQKAFGAKIIHALQMLVTWRKMHRTTASGIWYFFPECGTIFELGLYFCRWWIPNIHVFVRRVGVPLLARQVPPDAQTTTWLTTVPLAALGFLLWQVPNPKNPNFINILYQSGAFCIIWTAYVWFCFRFSRPTLCFESWLLFAESRKKQTSEHHQNIHWRTPSWCKTWCQIVKKQEKAGNPMGNSTGFSPKGNPPNFPLASFSCLPGSAHPLCLPGMSEPYSLDTCCEIHFKSSGWFSRRLGRFSDFKQQNWRIICYQSGSCADFNMLFSQN